MWDTEYLPHTGSVGSGSLIPEPPPPIPGGSVPRIPEHSKRCERAIRPVCVCSSCGGSRHGWLGHLERARLGDPGVRELREPAKKLWSDRCRHFDENGRRTPTKYLRQAGGAVARAGAVAWLSAHPTGIQLIEGLGTALNEEVFADRLWRYAEQAAEGEPPSFNDYGRAIAGHFWCDLFAEIADVLDRGAKLLARVPEGLKEAVLEHEDAKEWGPVRTELTGEALNLLWQCAQKVLGADPKSAALYLRILAILICPDPGAHPRVARGCLRPLAADTLREHLGVDIKPEWLWPDPS